MKDIATSGADQTEDKREKKRDAKRLKKMKPEKSKVSSEFGTSHVKIKFEVRVPGHSYFMNECGISVAPPEPIVMGGFLAESIAIHIYNNPAMYWRALTVVHTDSPLSRSATSNE